jgi:hypothetical protein
VLHKCANPACSSLFRSLSRGKLFLLQTDSAAWGITPAHRRERSTRRMERYWLCDACSAVLTLAFERGRGMVTVPLPGRETQMPPLHLTQMRPTLKLYRAELKGAL